MSDEFIAAIEMHQAAFGLTLSDGQTEHLARFYSIIQESNELLHLVAPMSAEEFAVRHILESLTMLEYLGNDIRFADVGAGAGLPSIPCLIVRPVLKAVLIESKEKKAKFLTKAVADLGITDRTRVVNAQFAEVTAEQFSVVTCRALDKFTQKLPGLIKWARAARYFFLEGLRCGRLSKIKN